MELFHELGLRKKMQRTTVKRWHQASQARCQRIANPPDRRYEGVGTTRGRTVPPLRSPAFAVLALHCHPPVLSCVALDHTRVLTALADATAAGDEITVSGIARRAGVDRLYRHPDLLEQLHTLQAQPP